jgi:hypothetical protein
VELAVDFNTIQMPASLEKVLQTRGAAAQCFEYRAGRTFGYADASCQRVAGNENSSMRKGDAGDQQVGPTDPLQVPDLPESVELGGHGTIHADDIPAMQLVLELIQPELSTLELNAIRSLEQNIERALALPKKSRLPKKSGGCPKTRPFVYLWLAETRNVA